MNIKKLDVRREPDFDKSHSKYVIDPVQEDGPDILERVMVYNFLKHRLLDGEYKSIYMSAIRGHHTPQQLRKAIKKVAAEILSQIADPTPETIERESGIFREIIELDDSECPWFNARG